MPTYFRGPRCNVDNCRSTLYQTFDGQTVCKLGHVRQGDVEIADEEFTALGRKRNRGPRNTQHDNSRLSQREQTAISTAHLSQALLVAQAVALVTKMGFPSQFTDCVRSLWTMVLSSASALNGAEEDEMAEEAEANNDDDHDQNEDEIPNEEDQDTDRETDEDTDEEWTFESKLSEAGMDTNYFDYGRRLMPRRQKWLLQRLRPTAARREILKRGPRVTMVPVIISSAILFMRLPYTLVDMVLWLREGVLPYYRFAEPERHVVPETVRKKLLEAEIQRVLRQTTTIPGPRELCRDTKEFLCAIYLFRDIVPPPVNSMPIMWKIVEMFRLPLQTFEGSLRFDEVLGQRMYSPLVFNRGASYEMHAAFKVIFVTDVLFWGPFEANPTEYAVSTWCQWLEVMQSRFAWVHKEKTEYRDTDWLQIDPNRVETLTTREMEMALSFFHEYAGHVTRPTVPAALRDFFPLPRERLERGRQARLRQQEPQTHSSKDLYEQDISVIYGGTKTTSQQDPQLLRVAILKFMITTVSQLTGGIARAEWNYRFHRKKFLQRVYAYHEDHRNK